MSDPKHSRRVLTVRLGDELMRELRKYCAAESVSISDGVRTLLADALFAQDEAIYAGRCARAVREELDRWVSSERISRALAADDFYDRLSVGLESDIADVRAIAGGTLLIASQQMAGESGRSASDIAEDAVRRGPYVGTPLSAPDQEEV